MSEQIKPGDLVVVVKPTRCPNAPAGYHLGLVFTVLSLRVASGHCEWCSGNHWRGEFMAEGPTHFYAVDRLKRIPPLNELEGEKRSEEISA